TVTTEHLHPIVFATVRDRRIILGHPDGTVCHADLTGKILRTFKGPAKATNIQFTPDGKRLIFRPTDNDEAPSEVWDVEKRKRLYKLEVKGAYLSSIFNSTGPVQASFVKEGDELHLRLWDASQEGEVLATLALGSARIYEGSFKDVAFTPDGR